MYRRLKLRKLAVLSALMWLSTAIGVHANAKPSKDFVVKGFHLDLRIQVMKMPALKAFVQNLSKNGINTLVMEWEASYPYEKHAVISSKFAYSRAEVKEFVAYCSTLGIDVIPLQQSFGHVEYILKHYRYKDLREDQKDFSQVNPIKEDKCKALFADLFKDLISTHQSPYFHIGGDETYLLGHSPESKEKAAKLGMGRLYGDYIKMLCELVVSLGKRPVVWADIALKYPDALQSLPKQTVLIDWNYGWDLDRFGDHEKLMKSGFEIWGSPAIRSAQDNYFLTDWNKHFNNAKTFIPQARQLGYKGIVMTSWSTSGLYSTVLESSTEVIELYAIRRVYPISGFNLLISAFYKSLSSSKALNQDEFVPQYAIENYGLSKVDAKLFWEALKLAPYEVNQGKVNRPNISIKQLKDSANYSFNTLQKLKVSKGIKEFNHYVLMANIRYNYLATMEIEAEVNLATYERSKAAVFLSALKKLNVIAVDQKFNELNAYLLNEEELKQEKELRNYRYNELVAKLTKQLNQK